MIRKFKIILLFVLIGILTLVLVVQYQDRTAQRGDKTDKTDKTGRAELALPKLSDASYDWIGSRIYQNEARGQAEYLTYWGEGEDFPSLGIGHFIWFPQGVDAPFDEQFPDMVSFVRKHSPKILQAPAWLRGLDPFAAPWTSKKQFDAAWSSPEMSALRKWLEETRQYQARFIVSTFEKRWRELELPARQKQDFNQLLQKLVETSEGLFAVVDYYNFKGLGNNSRERYQGQGWGLIQVLEVLVELHVEEDDCRAIIGKFRDAAADRLELRVELSPPERNEARWLVGWMTRLDAYLENDTTKGTPGACGFRVTPYVQNPGKDAITLIWFSNDSRAGQLRVWKSASGSSENAVLFESSPVRADALHYHPVENCDSSNCTLPAPPFLHQLRVTGLEAGTLYQYQVQQNIERASGSFLTLDANEKPLRFIVYADSETEPESTGKHTTWPGGDKHARNRKYPVDQTTGYAQNLKIIQQRQAGFVAIAGDLVQSGGEQRDWDEFWIHNAPLAASTVIFPALGNHDYFGGPGSFGQYETGDSERAVRKYQTYFDLPDNGSSDKTHAERYYAIHYGPITLIVLDTNDGLPHRSEQDTNWRLRGESDGGYAPDWHPGSEQHRWLEKKLRQAQETSRFTFVMFHGAPYTSGFHGLPPGERPGGDILSALPIQALTPLFLRYGVDAVFNGHDEMYEHSVVSGLEISADGVSREHEIHFIDIGIGGDDLRAPVKSVLNPHQVFLAHSDSPEIYGSDGILRDGGKHYGHMEINVGKNSTGQWQAQFDAVYVFPLLDSDRRVLGFERRIYDDSFILIADKLE